jgi:hypothetical protein
VLCPALWVNVKIPQNVNEMDPLHGHRKGLMLVTLVNCSCMGLERSEGNQRFFVCNGTLLEKSAHFFRSLSAASLMPLSCDCRRFIAFNEFKPMRFLRSKHNSCVSMATDRSALRTKGEKRKPEPSISSFWHSECGYSLM